MTTSDHRYKLERQSITGRPKKKYICPACGKKRFTLYIDTAGSKNEPLSSDVGMCDRSNNCKYHYTPSEYLADNGIKKDFKPIPKIETRPPSFIDTGLFEKTLNKDNNFLYALRNVYKIDSDPLLHKYFIGTADQWKGANVFWQVDINYKIRAGKIMLYSPFTCKRSKQNEGTEDEKSMVTWVHSALNIKDYNLEQCLFGEHLLKNYKGQNIAVVESEKTAVICSHFYPDNIWLATGGKQMCHKRMREILPGKNALLFPDRDAFEEWDKIGIAMCLPEIYNNYPDEVSDLADIIKHDLSVNN